MWIYYGLLIFPRWWRTCNFLPPSINVRYQKLSTEILSNRNVRSEARALQIKQNYVCYQSDKSTICVGAELGPAGYKFHMPFPHNSIQEHLFAIKMMWLKPTNMNMNLPCLLEAREEITGTMDEDAVEWDSTGMLCGSVLKKRRSKMNKHKYRKRRKKFKFLRRALGK